MITKNGINHFFADPDYAGLVDLDREQRLLFITDLSETRISAFLAWVFRPHEGHGLGDRGIKELLQRAWEANETEELGLKVPVPAEVRSLSYQDLLVYTEYQVGAPVKKKRKPGQGAKRKRSKGAAVDLLLLSRTNKLLIAIENKFGSKLHSNQLKTYRTNLLKRFPGFRCVFVYLDWNENDPADDCWCPLDYQWIIDMISSQQAAGLLSEKALDALAQVKEYINDEAPVNNDVAHLRDRRIEALGSKYPAVLAVLDAWRKTPARNLLTSKKEITEPLLVEYLQRRRLWNDVLDQRKHADVIVRVRRELGDTVEVGSGTSACYFQMKDWSRFEDENAEYWGARVVAWSGRSQSRKYSVQAGVLFNSVKPDFSDRVRAAAVAMRDGKLKAAPPAANWVSLGKQDGLGAAKAAELIVRALRGMDARLSQI